MFTMNRLRNYPEFAPIGAIVLSIAASMAAFANDDPFPGDIYALRPPHVRLSKPGESATDPRGGRSFPYNIAPPAIPPQDEVRLTEQDPLTLVYPSSGGSYSSGPTKRYDRLRFVEHQLQLDVFYFPIALTGDAFMPQAERTLFVGQLPAGEYEVAVRTWHLAPDVPWWQLVYPPDFDPESFEPPDDYTIYIPPAVPPPGIYATFRAPMYPGDPAVMIPSSFQFTVLALPEPAVVHALVAVTFCLGMCSRIKSRRRL